MSRIPRDVSHKELCVSLGKYGYSIKIGTLNKILTDVATYLKIKKEKRFEIL
jgi:hypothetical protein